MTSNIIINSANLNIQRDLNTIINEISGYKTEENMWKIDGRITNSAANLALHLAGSVNHFIGSVLGKNGYIRNRDLEFSEKSVDRTIIVDKLAKTIEMVGKVLPNLTEEDILADFPLLINGDTIATGSFLIFISGHVTYHLGQINYHRRLLDI